MNDPQVEGAAAGQVQTATEKIHNRPDDLAAEVPRDSAQARLAAIVDSSADAIIGKSLDGTVLSWNSVRS